MSDITSPEHIKQYAAIHESKRYGVSGNKFAAHLQIAILELRPKVVLDYGCGQTNLTGSVDFFDAQYLRYDPAIPELITTPETKADLIINTDVLEHIPGPDIDPLLAHIASLGKHAFFSIATSPAKEILPNGQNAHCSVFPGEVWVERIRKFFPEARLLKASRRNSALIITWPSRVTGLIELVDEHFLYKRRATKTLLGRIVFGNR
jgi:2-polyprenyl-3-methyl-5-hydroxy-6-metoxy-1,4-benzoquinol methylase